MKSSRLIPSTLILLFSLLLFTISCKKKKDPDPVNPTPEPPKEIPLTFTDFSPKSAMVGTAVMIIGTAFGTDANKVAIKFSGSVAVKPKAITETSLTVDVPQDATTGKIELNVNGKIVTSTETFTLTLYNV